MDALPGPAYIKACRLTGSNQITHRFMWLIWHPDADQVARPQQTRQGDRIPVVVLYQAVDRRELRWCNNDTSYASSHKPPVEGVAAWPRFICAFDLSMSLRNTLQLRDDCRWIVRELPINLTFPLRLGSASAIAMVVL